VDALLNRDTSDLPDDAPLSVLDGVRCDFVPVDDDTFALTHTQDVEPIFDFNKAHATDGSGGWSPSRDIRHVARVPNVVYYHMLNAHGVDMLNKDHTEAVKRLLNSSEYAHVRTGGGMI
jgi:hypothetical protein